jgi:GTPase KRas protein
VAVDNTNHRLQVLDTSGHHGHAILQAQGIQASEGFLIVYNISSRSSFIEAQIFYDQIAIIKKSSLPPLVLVGNKSDDILNREISFKEGSVLAKKLGCKFIETSAKQHLNVEKAFSDVVRELAKMSQGKVGGRENGEKRVQTQHISNTSNSTLVRVWGFFAQYIQLCVGQRGK